MASACLLNRSRIQLSNGNLYSHGPRVYAPQNSSQLIDNSAVSGRCRSRRRAPAHRLDQASYSECSPLRARGDLRGGIGGAHRQARTMAGKKNAKRLLIRERGRIGRPPLNIFPSLPDIIQIDLGEFFTEVLDSAQEGITTLNQCPSSHSLRFAIFCYSLNILGALRHPSNQANIRFHTSTIFAGLWRLWPSPTYRTNTTLLP